MPLHSVSILTSNIPELPDSVDATKNVSTSKKYGEIIKEKRKIYLSEGLNKKEKKGFMGVPPATPTHG